MYGPKPATWLDNQSYPHGSLALAFFCTPTLSKMAIAEIWSMSMAIGLGLARFSVNVSGPVTVIGFLVWTVPRNMRMKPIAWVFTIRWNDQATSSAGSGLPKLLLTPFRSVNL